MANSNKRLTNISYEQKGATLLHQVMEGLTPLETCMLREKVRSIEVSYVDFGNLIDHLKFNGVTLGYCFCLLVVRDAKFSVANNQ